VKIGNIASYAEHVHGDKQAKHMAAIGWRKLWDVAKDKTKRITRIYNAWVDRALKLAGLK
jgi:hypothetical protein